MTLAVRLIAALGLVLSLYALWVRAAKPARTFCDFGKHVSCSKAFSSREGAILGLPNPLFGIAFYLLIIGFPGSPVALAAVLAAVALSFYLGWILYRQQNACVVCISTYVVNVALLVLLL